MTTPINPTPAASAERPANAGCVQQACSASSELLECLQEWADEFRSKRHPASLVIYRAIQRIAEKDEAGIWLKATDINRPGGWYWTRCAEDDGCPQVVFVALGKDGDAAPDFQVLCMGEDAHTAKRLKHYAANGWEFMGIPAPETLLLGAERMSEAQRSSPSAPGGDHLLNDQVEARRK